MSFLKIPILLPSIWLFNISFTSPTTPPDQSERVCSSTLRERIFPTLFPIMHKLSASIPCIAELIVVLAINFPSTLSSEVLSRLVLSDQLPTSSVNCYFFLGSIIAAIGSLGRIWCFRTLGRHFTHHLSIRKGHKLITTGPYALVRHPGYLFGVVSGFGMSLMIASPGSFTRCCGWLETAFGKLVIGVWAMQNVLVWVLGYLRCGNEDALLRERFREEWVSYSQRVRYRMIPGVY